MNRAISRTALALAFVTATALAPVRARATGADTSATAARLAELERKVEALALELAAARTGSAPDSTGMASMGATGLGPGAGKVYAGRGISIGGYGEVLYENFDRERGDGTLSSASDRVDALRHVLYAGFKFDDALLFNSELEVEHGGVLDEGDVEVDPATGRGSAELSGEVKLEFAYVDWMWSPALGMRAGFLLVPVGVVNEMHEPTTFAGARRPEVERSLIPATWSALGIGLHGARGPVTWRAYLMEGLDARGFTATGGYRGGRQGGSRALASRPALAARADWSGPGGLSAGGSAYTGEVWQGAKPAGIALAPRLTLGEVHARCEIGGLETRALAVTGRLTDAGPVSDVLGLAGKARLGGRSWGVQASAMLDVMPWISPGSRMRLAPYARFERWDTQQDVAGGVDDPAGGRRVTVTGLALQPHPGVIFKADREWRENGADTETSQWNLSLGWIY